MKYKVGDRVCYKHQNPNDNVEVGEVGTICGISELTGNYGVAFETKDIYKHSCDGLCRDNYGWWCDENTLEPADNIVRMADGTIIGDFSTGGFCDGFRGGKIPNDLIVSHTEMERLSKALEKLGQKLKEENNLKFTFYVKEGTRPDKKCNGLIPTMTTTVVDASGKKATVTCDKADYSERQGVLEAIAQIACGGNFDKEYDKAVKKNKLIELHDRTCTYCGGSPHLILTIQEETRDGTVVNNKFKIKVECVADDE